MGTSPDFSNLSEFAREGIAFGEQLDRESDRGAALVGLAFLDVQLKRLFEAKMLDQTIAKKLLNYPGPLSTAAARTDVAYGLGWIEVKTYRDLVTLRNIRDRFAHAHEPIRFTDSAVEILCAKLELGKPAFAASIPTSFAPPRMQFTYAAASIAMRLEFYRRTTGIPHGPPEKWQEV